MTRSLREDAIDIWSAGVAAVDSARLVEAAICRRGDEIQIAGESLRLSEIDRIVVIGGGKAGAGMAAGFEQALGADVVDDRVSGWLNVPADCVRTLRKIHLHAGRPAGVNEPTEQGVLGTVRILEMAASLTPRDLCIVLLSGGGSALLPAPIEGITLADKQIVTRLLMQSGATIDELNTVRSCLSQFKGGGLLRSLSAGRGVALIISDVVNDPLPVIASGPTVNVFPNPTVALQILHQLVSPTSIPANVLQVLQRAATSDQRPSSAALPPFRNVIIGNNQTAIDAAALRAAELNYRVARQTTNERGIARDIGRDLAEQSLEWRTHRTTGRGWCFLSGGEPVVQMVATTQPRKGGRNQELVLAAAERLWNEPLTGLAILSGGTDGEDGPTDAAGAV
ncbi:MAG: hypothetical protein B7Z40_15425, partial [Bosea sp. 12-68-7]